MRISQLATFDYQRLSPGTIESDDGNIIYRWWIFRCYVPFIDDFPII